MMAAAQTSMLGVLPYTVLRDCNRHTFASRLVMAGVDLHTVGELTPGNRGEPEYRALTILGVTDKDMPGLVGHLDAVAGRRIGALDPFQ